MISHATMNLKPAAIELDVGAASKCPLWVKSRHVQCKQVCPLAPRRFDLSQIAHCRTRLEFGRRRSWVSTCLRSDVGCSSLRLYWLRVTARRRAARSIFVSQDVPQVFQSIEIEHWWCRWRMPRLIAVVQIPADFPGGERQT